VHYLTDSTRLFGVLTWAFLVIQILALLGGIYLLVRQDSHPVRGPALRRLAIAIVVLAALGTLAGALRVATIDPFTERLWSYLIAALEVILAIVAVIYSRTTYLSQLAERSTSSARGARRPSPASRSSLSTSPSSSTATRSAVSVAPSARGGGSRRDARRDRKRRKR